MAAASSQRALTATLETDSSQPKIAALRLVPATNPARVQALTRPSSVAGTWSMIMRSQAVSSSTANRLCARKISPSAPTRPASTRGRSARVA